MKIVGGSARGRIIEAPPGRNTRPTSAVLREALFGILSGTVPQARVLDLFCGSGAIALEAISRGAKQAVLIDADAKAIQTASKNCKALRMDEQCRIYRNDFEKALRILKRKGEQFDFVYVDPPYQGGLYEAALKGLFPSLVAEGGVVVLEHAATDEMPFLPPICKKGRTRVYGTRAITFYTGAEEHEDRVFPRQL